LFSDENKIEKEEIKKEFKPYLLRDSVNKAGVIGKLSNFTDILGRKLYVGDTVIIFHDGEEDTTESIITEEYDRFNVMGLYYYDFPNGEYLGYKILKKRSYKDVKYGEAIRGIKYVKS
jgi:hypothetical protein